MSEQPGDVLGEAAKLFDAVIRRVSGAGDRGRGTGRPDPGEPDQSGPEADGPEAGGPDAHDDVWAWATAREPRIATGAPECRDCPICRAIAVKREAGGDVGRHLHEAGQSLMAAALDVVAAFDRTRRNRPPEASKRSRAGRSERSERPDKGDAWSAATGGGPADIG